MLKTKEADRAEKLLSWGLVTNPGMFEFPCMLTCSADAAVCTMAPLTRPSSAARTRGSIANTDMKDIKLDMSAADRFLAKCVVFFHFSMFSWGFWILMVVAAYWSRVSAALMTLYLAYIFLYQGNHALQEHVYPQHCRRSVQACFSDHSKENAVRHLLCWPVGLVGRGSSILPGQAAPDSRP